MPTDRSVQTAISLPPGVDFEEYRQFQTEGPLDTSSSRIHTEGSFDNERHSDSTEQRGERAGSDVTGLWSDNDAEYGSSTNLADISSSEDLSDTENRLQDFDTRHPLLRRRYFAIRTNNLSEFALEPFVHSEPPPNYSDVIAENIQGDRNESPTLSFATQSDDTAPPPNYSDIIFDSTEENETSDSESLPSRFTIETDDLESLPSRYTIDTSDSDSLSSRFTIDSPSSVNF